MIVDGIQAALLRGASAKPPPGADPVVAGWLELGGILADAKSGALGTQRRLQAWRARYPAHPAVDSLWKGVTERPVAPGGQPRQVALLLPLSGRAAAAGGAVRDGGNARENLARSRRNVAQVADRRRDDVEHAR
jgi:outer membrane PBP1 activator LpoA protein